MREEKIKLLSQVKQVDSMSQSCNRHKAVIQITEPGALDSNTILELTKGINEKLIFCL